MTPIEIGAKIKILMRERRMTQEEMAAMVDCHQTSISLAWRGKLPDLQKKMLQILTGPGVASDVPVCAIGRARCFNHCHRAEGCPIHVKGSGTIQPFGSPMPRVEVGYIPNQFRPGN